MFRRPFCKPLLLLLVVVWLVGFVSCFQQQSSIFARRHPPPFVFAATTTPSVVDDDATTTTTTFTTTTITEEEEEEAFVPLQPSIEVKLVERGGEGEGTVVDDEETETESLLLQDQQQQQERQAEQQRQPRLLKTHHHLIASTYQPREFNPVTPIFDNQHVQTIVGGLYRHKEQCQYVTVVDDDDNFQSKLYQISQALNSDSAAGEEAQEDWFWDERETIETPNDNDFYHVDYKYAATATATATPRGEEDDDISSGGGGGGRSSKGLVVFVHGLQSNSNSTLSIEMAQAFVDKGFDVACINFRGCSGVPNNNLRSYNLGFTNDLKHYLGLLKNRTSNNYTSNQHSNIYLCGKSLGANVVLKALGELGSQAYGEYNIRGAAVACSPFDNNRNKGFLQSGFSKLVYNENLLRSLKQMGLKQLERLEDTCPEQAALVNVDLLQNATTITEFDDAYTAPLFGYRDHVDYYNQSSCLHYLSSIKVPTYIVSAKDDPFMDPNIFPASQFGCDSPLGQARKSPIKMKLTPKGGHLGYMFHQWKKPEGGGVAPPKVSFLPMEMARFLNHVSMGQQLELLDDDELVESETAAAAPPGEEVEEEATTITTTAQQQQQEKDLSSLSLSISSSPISSPLLLGKTTSKRKKNLVPDLDNFRENAFRVSWTFRPRDYKPSPLLSNCHFQTISGVYLRNDVTSRYVVTAKQGDGGLAFRKTQQLAAALASGIEPDRFGAFWDYRQRIKTLDGKDFFDVDYKYADISGGGDPSSKGIVVIIHGLQSNSNSSLSVDMARAYRKKGLDVACINFRGCSGQPNDNLRAYHLGFTDDLMHYLSILNSGFKKPPPIFLSGFSLGANVVLKALGEMGLKAYEEYNIYGAAVSGAPFDNERNIQFVQKPGFNKLAYNGPLLASMKKAALTQLQRFPDSEEAMKLSVKKIAEATEISDIENEIIAPLFGFEDNIDYYRQTSCIKFLDDIRIPTLIMNAADDPFFDPDFFPDEKGCHSYEGRQNKSPITLVRTKHGGHLGYMFHMISEEDDDDEYDTDVSFMPTELSRFVQHVWERRVFLEQKQQQQQQPPQPQQQSVPTTSSINQDKATTTTTTTPAAATVATTSELQSDTTEGSSLRSRLALVSLLSRFVEYIKERRRRRGGVVTLQEQQKLSQPQPQPQQQHQQQVPTTTTTTTTSSSKDNKEATTTKSKSLQSDERKKASSSSRSPPRLKRRVPLLSLLAGFVGHVRGERGGVALEQQQQQQHQQKHAPKKTKTRGGVSSSNSVVKAQEEEGSASTTTKETATAFLKKKKNIFTERRRRDRALKKKKQKKKKTPMIGTRRVYNFVNDCRDIARLIAAQID